VPLKNFVICLAAYPKSLGPAQAALKSGQQHGWDIELFPGVDGSTVTVDQLVAQWGIRINTDNRKCQRQMYERSGVRGCFLSHWLLWHKCADLEETIGIFEHDVAFLKPPGNFSQFQDVLKLVEGFDPRRPMPAGVWYEGSGGYLVTPAGAKKLIDWTLLNGCLPSDVAIGRDVVDIVLCQDNYVQLVRGRTDVDKRVDSFTWNLESMK
jgi:GR25 family glycosyltransferase involved in LPS biosynthesis